MARVRAEVRNVMSVGPLLVRHPTDLLTGLDWLAGKDDLLLADGAPWWPRRAIRHVGQRLPAGARVFEYGGGGSTLWLQRQGARVTTVEHDGVWAEMLRQHTSADRTTVLFRPPSGSGHLASDSADGFFDDYVAAVDAVTEPLDLVIVDGRCRVACSLRAKDKVRQGGLLLLDDSHRPKYAAVHEALSDWTAHHVTGIKRGSREVCRTTIWKRPTA
jgi:hypothetical protein